MLASLPPELLSHIFTFVLPPPPLRSYSEACERQSELVRFALVNSAWSDVAHRELYRHICLEDEAQATKLLRTWETSDGMVLAGRVSSIRLQHFMSRGSEIASQVVNACEGVRELWVTRCRHFRLDGLSGMSITTLHLDTTALTRPLLPTFPPNLLPNLTRLTVHTTIVRDLTALLLLSRPAFSSLSTLLLLSTFDDVDTSLDEEVAAVLPSPSHSLAPSLRFLLLDPEAGNDTIPEFLWPFLASCTALETLVLADELSLTLAHVNCVPPSLIARSVGDASWAALVLEQCPRLRYLQVSDGDGTSLEAVGMLEAQCERRGVEVQRRRPTVDTDPEVMQDHYISIHDNLVRAIK